jgi:DNA-binding protein HU-beta
MGGSIVNFSELVKTTARQTGETVATVQRVLDGFGAVTAQTLAQGDDVRWPNVGVFNVAERKERSGRNPQTGETLKIAAQKGVHFKASSTLKEHLNPSKPRRPR